MLILFITLSFLALRVLAAAPAGPWDRFNFAPKSRTSRPVTIHSVQGNVLSAHDLLGNGSATLTGNGSFIVIDFGQEVGGRVFLTIDKSSSNSRLSLSFTESSEFISPVNSDDSCRTVRTMDGDGVQSLPTPLPQGKFMQTVGQQRGGFRYMTIASNSNSPVSISRAGVENTFMPHWDDLRAYNGYFFTHDLGFHDTDFLTKLWYAGAYTVQTNTIDSHQARQQPCPSPKGWNNSASGGPVVGPILVDGAKRDRYRSAAGYNFDHSYTSHSHGWATGPTPAMTFHILGIGITSPQGQTWTITPVLSGLESAEGGLTTGLGWFGVKWNTTDNVLTVEISTPEGTSGSVMLPGEGDLTVDGKTMSGGRAELNGGNHVLTRSSI
ncbi:hypothetical protein AN958_07997 [Leucoagaricus sp. SymC.cos]|nr:hypothetical protein AN958_07997 [Leucoagaricus sp. SymC.cos]